MAQNKKAIFPFCDATAEFLHKLETVNPNDIRTAHIYDTLDSEAAQDNLDVADNIDCEEFSIQHPGSFDNIPDGSGRPEKFKYKSIDFSNIDELLYLDRQLIPEQRRAFDKVLGFCQKVARQAVARDHLFHQFVSLSMEVQVLESLMSFGHFLSGQKKLCARQVTTQTSLKFSFLLQLEWRLLLMVAQQCTLRSSSILAIFCLL
jgi:hypothetical protein